MTHIRQALNTLTVVVGLIVFAAMIGAAGHMIAGAP